MDRTPARISHLRPAAITTCRMPRIELRFDLDQRQVIGQVTHTLTTLKDGLRELDFDSVGLTIQSASLDGKEARFLDR